MGPVHVLINNAGIMFGGRKETEEVSRKAENRQKGKILVLLHPILDTRISFFFSSVLLRNAQGTPPEF